MSSINGLRKVDSSAAHYASEARHSIGKLLIRISELEKRGDAEAAWDLLQMAADLSDTAWDFSGDPVEFNEVSP